MNLPDGFVKAISLRQHNLPGRLSATTLLNGVKHIQLTKRHWDELVEDAADHAYAVFGSAVHKILEEEGADEFSEESMSFEVDGVVVTGRIDNYNMKEGVISDFKTCSVWKVKFQSFDDWRRQGLIYAWLLIKNGFEVKTCRFIAMIKDHSKRDAKRDSSYPLCPTYVYEFPVTKTGLDEIETFIRGKIAVYTQHQETPDDDIPPCSPEERWDKPTKYAVKKEGRKTAVRVFDSRDEAEKMTADLGKGHYLEARLGESTRCMDYCSCAAFCSYYRDNVVAVEAQGEVNWP
jgi:hypothetical protein